MKYISLLFTQGMCIMFSFQRIKYEGGIKSGFIVEQPNEYYLSQVMKVNIKSNKSH